MSIHSLLNQIKNEEIVLPGIQRDFVWPEERIARLLDSIMRGYPIGITLLWETYNDIQYRTFVKDHRQETIYAYRDNPRNRKLKLVLDGQQRLQSLYIALYGTLEGKPLYFDVLSGRDSDDLAEDKFHFEFLSPDEVEERNALIREQLSRPIEKREKNFFVSRYIKVEDLFKMGAAEKQKLRRRLSEELSLSDDDELRVDINLSRFIEALSKDESILRVSIIDEELAHESDFRKSDADVLEIFVRVNREITPLSRSDLIFSMLKLKWKESAEALPEFVRRVNKGNSFDLDTDFVIRCLFAISDLGTKFDINLLRKKNNVEKLRANFQRCCDSIRATVDFVQKDCWCQSSRVIGGALTMVPFVYYLFHTKKHEIRNDQIVNVRKALHLFGFTRPFSRYADSRLGAFIRWELKPLVKDNNEIFPLDRVVFWIGYWERIRTYGEDFLSANHMLTLHLVQGLRGERFQYERNAPELDHIFPRSQLRKMDFDEKIINHFANFWVLAKGKNLNKSNRHPAEYFKDVNTGILNEALIDREFLDYRRYTTFINTRKEKILTKIKRKLQFSDKDFYIADET